MPLYDDIRERVRLANLGADVSLLQVPFLGPYFVRRCATHGATSPRTLVRLFAARCVAEPLLRMRRFAVARTAAVLAQNRRANRCTSTDGNPSRRHSLERYWIADVNARAYCALLACADLFWATCAPAAALPALNPGGMGAVALAIPPQLRPPAGGSYPSSLCACLTSRAWCTGRRWRGQCRWQNPPIPIPGVPSGAAGVCVPAAPARSSTSIPGTSAQGQSLPWPVGVVARGQYSRRDPRARVAWRRSGRVPEAIL